MVRKALLGAILLLALAASPAAAQYSPTVVSPGTISPGGTVTVSGQSCAADEVVTITLTPQNGSASSTTVQHHTDLAAARSASQGPIVVATVTADANGNYTATFVVPANLPLGRYTVTASCGSGVAGRTLNVVAPSTGTTQPGTGAQPGTRGNNAGNGGGKLVRTGANLDRMGLAGAGLLIAGGLLLVATKRRRHATGMAV